MKYASNYFRARLFPRPSAFFLLPVLFFALGPVPSFAQDISPPESQRPRRVGPVVATPDEEVLKVDTDLVLVDVTVTEPGGTPVRGLRQQDFKLYEDGVERPLAFFKVEKKNDPSRPLAVVFALDISGSMSAQETERLRGAVRTFVARLIERPYVFAVMSFGMKVKVIQNFTNDARKLDRAFDALAREPNGLSTHVYDAVDDAVRLLVRRAPRTREQRLLKRAVVVITDGFPVGDTVSPATVIERANSADVSVYTVTLPSYSRMLASAERAPLPTPLDVSGLAEKTGGSNVYATGQDFEALFSALADEVTSSYVLAFYPSEEKRRDGRFHTIRVEGPRGLVIRQSRPGYQLEGGQ